jgi:D-glycero-alpha-D-manno-heptose-7-phosphate kinase
MLISKTPLRLGLFCGGSDLPSFYSMEEGAALSITIDKYIYVMTHTTPHIGVRTMYDVVEDSSTLEAMQHRITKETLRHFDITKELTVASISDILSKGSGLGSSSAFTVGLIRNISYLKYGIDSKKYIAENACNVEMNLCSYPVGKQDQYASSYGGLNFFRFGTDGTVTRDNINISRNTLNTLENNLLLVYSGKGRQANIILQQQQEAMLDKDKFAIVAKARDMAYEGLKYLQNGDIDYLGDAFKESWNNKKKLVSSISNEYIDQVYNFATKNGATSGKLLGAGGGGFFLFYVKNYNRKKLSQLIVNEFPLCKVYDFKFSYEGSQLLAMD